MSSGGTPRTAASSTAPGTTGTTAVSSESDGTTTVARILIDTPLSHPNISLVIFSGNDPRQIASDFWNSVDQKINFSLSTTLPTDTSAITYHK